MAWYIEYDHYPFSDHRCMPQRHLLILNCPDDIKARKTAGIEAIEQLKRFEFSNPMLVWKEVISHNKGADHDPGK